VLLFTVKFSRHALSNVCHFKKYQTVNI